MLALRLSRFSSLRAFAHHDYASVWLGALVSTLGTWMETIALGVYVTHTTGRAEWTGGIAALTFLPAIVLSPIGGALADRFDKRTWVACCSLAQALLAGLLTVLAFTGHLSVHAVAVVAFFNGCAGTLLMPAFAALLAELVPPADLHSALSLNSAQYNVGRILGPTLAAPVLAAGGIRWALLFNTLSFLAVLAALARVRAATPPKDSSHPSLRLALSQGLDAVRHDAGLSLALFLTLSAAFFIAPFIGLVPVLALRVFHLDAAATSFLVSAQGLGAVCAAVAVGPLVERLGRTRLLERTLWCLGPLAAFYWLVPSFPLALVAIGCLGACHLVSLTSLHTFCQSRAPRGLQARVSSLYSMVLGVGYAVGVWLQGALGDRLGIRLVTAGFALLFLTVVLSLRALRPRAFSALEA